MSVYKYSLQITHALKVMLHETIRSDDFWRNVALQHCCDIVSNSYKIVPTFQRCVALKIVVANRPCNITLTKAQYEGRSLREVLILACEYNCFS